MDAKRRGRKRQIKNDIKRPKKRTRLQGQETVDEVDEEPGLIVLPLFGDCNIHILE